MKKAWTDDAWNDYLEWQKKDKKVLKKINDLIKDIDRNGTKGLGKSEVLKHKKAYSKHIDDKNRLVFDIRNNELVIISCKGHYDD